MTEQEMLGAIAKRFGPKLTSFVEANSAGWVIEALANPETAEAFVAAHPELENLVIRPTPLVSRAASRRSERLRAWSHGG